VADHYACLRMSRDLAGCPCLSAHCRLGVKGCDLKAGVETMGRTQSLLETLIAQHRLTGGEMLKASAPS